MHSYIGYEYVLKVSQQVVGVHTIQQPLIEML